MRKQLDTTNLTVVIAAKFPEMSYAQLLKAILAELHGKFDQKPQVCPASRV